MVALFKREKEQNVEQPKVAPDQGAQMSESAPVQPPAPVEIAPQQQSEQPPQQPEAAPQEPQQEVQPAAIEQTPTEQQQTPEVQQPGVRSSNTAQDDTAAVQQQPVTPPVEKTEARKEIEDVLSEGLTEIYQTMTPQEQEKFRIKGEEAATEIEGMMSQFKATARKVAGIIRSWLSTIPRVNKYFLEQESKLKTDDIMKLQRKLKKKARMNSLGKK